jgi:hypothetical protein
MGIAEQAKWYDYRGLSPPLQIKEGDDLRSEEQKDQVCKDEKTGKGRGGLFWRIEHNWIEIAAAALLALATLMSAWSAYNSARWHGRSTEYYSKSDFALTRSSELLDMKIQDKIVDSVVFANYVNTILAGDKAATEAYRARLHPRLRAAIDAWEKTAPMTNPEAPRTPFQMAEYKDVYSEESTKVANEARKYSSKARTAMHNSNNFILLTVLFAGVLFFAGISTKFESKKVKLTMLGFGLVVFLASVVIFALQSNL